MARTEAPRGIAAGFKMKRCREIAANAKIPARASPGHSEESFFCSKASQSIGAMDPSELPELSEYLKVEAFENGEVVCQQGEAGDRVHFIERGRARVSFRPSHAEEETTLGTLCPGTMFGEMSILDRRPRSATVRAEGDLSCKVLHLGDFDRLCRDRPELALKLLRGMGQELSKRIRIGNRIASELGD